MDESSENEDLPFAPTPLPRHVAIVMDGNGRWARTRGKPRIYGHRAGAESVRRVVEACGEWGIEYLTLYAFSTENWRRPRDEVTALMELLVRYLRKEVDRLDHNNVRLATIGDLDRLPVRTREELAKGIQRLEGNTGLTLVVALSYGARDEIVRAVRRIAAAARDGKLDAASLTEEDFAQYLDTAGMPDPDLLIRTAGEMRLSNFLLWQASYAEYHSTPVCWPAFGREQLAEAIRDYQRRIRTFGKIVKKKG